MHFQKQHAALGLNGVTCQSAVAEPRPDVPQIAFLAERIGAMRTETFPEGRPAVDHYKVHVAPPKAKQKTVSDEFDRPGGGAQRCHGNHGVDGARVQTPAERCHRIGNGIMS